MQDQLDEADSEQLLLLALKTAPHDWHGGRAKAGAHAGRPGIQVISNGHGAPQIDRLVNQSGGFLHARSEHVCGGAARWWLTHRDLVWDLGGTSKQWSLRVPMVQSNSELQGSHVLLVVVKDDELSIDSVVLADQMEEGYPDVAKRDEVSIALLCDVVIILNP